MTKRIKMYTNNKPFNYKIEIYTYLCNQPIVKPKTIYACRDIDIT